MVNVTTRRATKFLHTKPQGLDPALTLLGASIGVWPGNYEAKDPRQVAGVMVILEAALELLEAYKSALEKDPAEAGRIFAEAPELLTCMRALGAEPSTELVHSLESIGYGDPMVQPEAPAEPHETVPDSPTTQYVEPAVFLDDTAASIVDVLEGDRALDLDGDWLLEVYEVETNGKNRKTVLTALDALLSD